MSVVFFHLRCIIHHFCCKNEGLTTFYRIGCHQCLKRKLVHNALLCIWSVDDNQIRQTQCMELFIVTYQGGIVLARGVLHGLQPLERNTYEYIQLEFDPRGRELVSSVQKIKSFTRS